MLNIESIRNDFPILREKIYEKPLVYLDNGATTQKPQVVIDHLVKYYTEQNSNIHRGVHYLSEQASDQYERAREKVRAFINAKEALEVVFTSGTTDSINLVAECFGQAHLTAGDEIIVSEMEHHSNIVPWQVTCEKQGATLKVLPIKSDGTLQLEKLDELITGKTKLLAITSVSNAIGVVNPIKKIIEKAHEQGVKVLVDAAQYIQHGPVDVQELDCDFLVFSGHKMYAGTGVGVLYGKRGILESLPPYRTGGGMIKNVSFEKTSYGELPFKFESGTGHIEGVAGLAIAIDYLESIGITNISAHEKELMTYAREKLSEIDNIVLYGTGELCGAISFNLKEVHPYDVGMILDKLGIAVRTGMHCAEPLMKRLNVPGVVRASFGLYNTKEEVDLLVKGVQRAQNMLS